MRVNTLFCLSCFMKLSFRMKRVCVLMEFPYGAQVTLYNDMLRKAIYDVWMTLMWLHHFICFPLVRKKIYGLHRNLSIVLHGRFVVY